MIDQIGIENDYALCVKRKEEKGLWKFYIGNFSLCAKWVKFSINLMNKKGRNVISSHPKTRNLLRSLCFVTQRLKRSITTITSSGENSGIISSP